MSLALVASVIPGLLKMDNEPSATFRTSSYVETQANSTENKRQGQLTDAVCGNAMIV
jgi:hypothetical protein